MRAIIENAHSRLDEIEHLIVLDIWNNNNIFVHLFRFFRSLSELHDARVRIVHTKRAGLKMKRHNRKQYTMTNRFLVEENPKQNIIIFYFESEMEKTNVK